MSWLMTGAMVATTAFGVYSSYQGGKAQAKEAKRRGRESMLTAMKNIELRTRRAYQQQSIALEQGTQTQMTAHINSKKDVSRAVSEGSGSGAVVESGTISEVIRAKQVRGDAIDQAIVANTNQNMEAIKTDTELANEAEWANALSQKNAYDRQSNMLNKQAENELLAGIVSTAVAGYSGYSTATKPTGGKPGKAFWTKDWASWDDIQSGNFTLG